MSGFLSTADLLFTNVVGENETEREICVSEIPTDEFHFFLMIPSVLTTLLLAFTISRKNVGTECLWGRPGAVFPQDILGKSHRFSYAAAWGAIAFLAADVTFGDTIIVDLKGPPYVTVFNKILSMVVLGVAYIPMFSSLALQSVTGYMVGTAYAWALLAVNIFRLTECDFSVGGRLILILRDLPLVMCLGYLSISLPFRTGQALKTRSQRIFSSSERVTFLSLKKDIDGSPEAVHVTKLLRPVLPPKGAESKSLVYKIVGAIKGLIHDWVYHRKKNFRYSARITSVMLMGLMIVYKLSLEAFVLVLGLIRLVLMGFDSALEVVGREPYEGEDETTATTREGINFLIFLTNNIQICFIVSMTLTCIFGVFGILHTLTSYRTNLQDLYKGDTTHIPHRNTMSNSSLLIGSMRYAGYQLAYIAWGFALHWLIIFLIAFALNVVITILLWGFTDWLVNIIAVSWPAGLLTVVVLLVQMLTAKFAFLQGRGEYLAINNRRVFFTFTYFMFFYNIFVGFLSCIMRILKSILIGAIFLPRLDNSTLPRRFQMLDPGFKAYCGFILVECSHTHPVLVMFLRLLMLEQKHRTLTDESSASSDDVQLNMNGKSRSSKKYKYKVKNVRARNRWLVAYTLTTNPALRAYRKSYMAAMKEMQERIARYYNLNKSAMGKLAADLNTAFVPTASPVGAASPQNAAMGNWNQLLSMNSFLFKLKQDMEMNSGMFAADEAPERTNADRDNDNKDGASGDKSPSENGVNIHFMSSTNKWKMATFKALTNESNETENNDHSPTDVDLSDISTNL